MIRQFSQNTMDRLIAMLRDWERYNRRVVDKLAPVASGPRIKSVPRNAIVTTTIKARNGMVKGQGIVSILCDDGTGTGTDAVIQTNVTVWNPYRSEITTNSAGRIVVIEIVDNLWQVRGADCP